MDLEVNSFPTDAALAEAAARRWLEELTRHTTPGKPYGVALAGGRIAGDFFHQIAVQAAGRASLFESVHFFWGDERCVPPDSPDSNYALAMRKFLEPLKIPAVQIHRLRGEAEESFAIADAVENIRSVLPGNDAGQPVLDQIFLGMGEEGHVASLFPGEPEEIAGGPAVFRAVTTPKPPPRRLTLGYAPLFAAKQVWVLASGKGKMQALLDSMGGGDTPLGRVLRGREKTSIFTDIPLARQDSGFVKSWT